MKGVDHSLDEHLARFHGVFTPNSRYLARVTTVRRGRGGRLSSSAGPEAPTPAERRVAVSRAQRLKPVLGIDIETRRK